MRERRVRCAVARQRRRRSGTVGLERPVDDVGGAERREVVGACTSEARDLAVVAAPARRSGGTGPARATPRSSTSTRCASASISARVCTWVPISGRAEAASRRSRPGGPATLASRDAERERRAGSPGAGGSSAASRRRTGGGGGSQCRLGARSDSLGGGRAEVDRTGDEGGGVERVDEARVPGARRAKSATVISSRSCSARSRRRSPSASALTARRHRRRAGCGTTPRSGDAGPQPSVIDLARQGVAEVVRRPGLPVREAQLAGGVRPERHGGHAGVVVDAARGRGRGVRRGTSTGAADDQHGVGRRRPAWPSALQHLGRALRSTTSTPAPGASSRPSAPGARRARPGSPGSVAAQRRRAAGSVRSAAVAGDGRRRRRRVGALTRASRRRRRRRSTPSSSASPRRRLHSGR